MSKYILFRKDRDNQEEYKAARHVWGDYLKESRVDCGGGFEVIGRYSTLPWYGELEKDLIKQGSSLVNTTSQYQWIADMDWYDTLSDMTPKTYFRSGYANVPDAPNGWVVKGLTNSRKFKWKTHMRAPTREDLKQVLNRCHDDVLLGSQGLVIREFVKLRTYETSLHGLPMTQEWRCFFWKGTLVQASFYWSQSEKAEDFVTIPPEALKFAQKAADRVKDFNNFFVIDVGELVDDMDHHVGWTVIEVNSGQMAGLSCGDPTEFYANLRELSR
jgi:hypothetical protein